MFRLSPHFVSAVPCGCPHMMADRCALIRVTAYGAMAAPNYRNFAAPGEALTGSSIGATGYNATATVTAMAARENGDGSSEIWLNLTMPAKAWAEGGAPRRLSVVFMARKRSPQPAGFTLDISLRTMEKTPSKHKETM